VTVLGYLFENLCYEYSPTAIDIAPATKPAKPATRGSSGKPFFINAYIENKELTAYEIAKKRVSG
jgi:hypothetical protein